MKKFLTSLLYLCLMHTVNAQIIEQEITPAQPNTGELVKQQKSVKGSNTLKVNVRGLKKGSYVLLITYDKYKDSRHILIE